jgi:homoserine dehydrogenase
MKPIRIGLLGCGTVGGGVVTLLCRQKDKLAERVGAPLEVERVLIRRGDKERVPELDRGRLTTDPETILSDRTLDVVVEVMGGLDPAQSYVERAIDQGQSVVTANKMLLATCGPALVERARQRGVDLAFEGSVGGGIPIVRVLRDALIGDGVTSLSGIVNGTCNYILTRMRQNGLGFAEALREAQAKGYAEADPTLDIDGHDAAHKLVVLAMVAFGARVEAGRVPTFGIRPIEAIDHRFAERFGFVIKHLCIGRDRDQKLDPAVAAAGAPSRRRLELRVHPALVPKETTLANVGGVLNAIAIEGRALGPCLLSGRGAGDLPTAVSVVADIVDVARARLHGTAGLATRGIRLDAPELVPFAEIETRYYLRFQVYDRPGVLGTIAGTLGTASVSIEQLVQEGRGDEQGRPVQIVILTHAAREKDVESALALIANFDFVARPTVVLRVEE